MFVPCWSVAAIGAPKWLTCTKAMGSALLDTLFPKGLCGLCQFCKKSIGRRLQCLGLLCIQGGNQLVGQPDVLAGDVAVGVQVGLCAGAARCIACKRLVRLPVCRLEARGSCSVLARSLFSCRIAVSWPCAFHMYSRPRSCGVVNALLAGL